MNNIVSTSGNFKSDAEQQALLTAIPVALIVVPTLDDIKRARIAQLSVDCQNAIYAGFVSSALGAVYTYPAKAQDQVNLAGSVLRSTLPGAQVAGWTTPFWCMDALGGWAYLPHTVTQIQRVGEDSAAAIVGCLVKNATLAGQVNAITDPSPAGIAQVGAIVW